MSTAIFVLTRVNAVLIVAPLFKNQEGWEMYAYAYAVSDGEGTLIDYGIASTDDMFDIVDESMADSHTLIVGPAERDPETGQ